MKTAKKPNTRPAWTMTNKQVQETGLSLRYLTELGSRGVLPRPDHGAWDGPAFMAGIVRHYQSLVRGGGERFKDARAEREVHRARREKIQADEAEGRLVDLESAKILFTRCARAVVTRLRGIPAKAAVLCEGKPIDERQEIIGREIDDATDQLFHENMDRLKKRSAAKG